MTISKLRSYVYPGTVGKAPQPPAIPPAPTATTTTTEPSETGHIPTPSRLPVRDFLEMLRARGKSIYFQLSQTMDIAQGGSDTNFGTTAIGANLWTDRYMVVTGFDVVIAPNSAAIPNSLNDTVGWRIRAGSSDTTASPWTPPSTQMVFGPDFPAGQAFHTTRTANETVSIRDVLVLAPRTGMWLDIYNASVAINAQTRYTISGHILSVDEPEVVDYGVTPNLRAMQTPKK